MSLKDDVLAAASDIVAKDAAIAAQLALLLAVISGPSTGAGSTVDVGGSAGVVNTLAKILSDANASLLANLPAGIGFTLEFDGTSGADVDPTAGKFRLNGASQSVATALRISEQDLFGVSIATQLDEILASTNSIKGYFRLTKVGDPTKYMVCRVTAAADPGAYRNVTIAIVGFSATNPFANGDTVFVSFRESGDAGADGADGAGAGDVQSDDPTTVVGKILGWSTTTKHTKGQDFAALLAGAGITTAEKVFGPYSGVSLAGTADISAANTLLVKITAGTGPITSFGATRDGWLRYVRADVAFTITRDAINLETPNGTDLSVGVGDHLIVVRESSESAAKTRVLQVIKADGRAYRGPNSIPENLFFEGVLSPSQITSNQNNYGPTGHQTALVERLNSDAARSITGLVAPTSGKCETRFLFNVGSFPITLSNENGSSTAGNRFTLGTDFVIQPDKCVILLYDVTTSRWRPLSQVIPIGALAYLDRVTSIDQNIAFSGRISPTQLSANTNDWAPTGLSTASVIRASTDASRNLTGLTGGADGRRIALYNVGTNNLVLKNEDSNSIAANRFSFGADRTLAGGDGIELWYDAVASRWLATAIVSSGGGGGGTTVFAIAGGRLTLSTGVKVMGAAVSGATSIYYTPDVAGQIGLYDGVSAWSLVAFTEKSVKLTDAQTCTLTSGNLQIQVPDATQLVVGMKASGTGLSGSPTIASLDDATHVTLTGGTVDISGTSSITFKCPADTGYDVFGKNVTGAPKLFLKKRSSILTANTMTTQDGVDVLSTDATLRWLGAVITGSTDGQADWSLSGQRRFRVWNRDNKRTLTHLEGFSASGTYYKVMGLLMLVATVAGGGSGASSSYGIGAAGAAGGLSIRTRFASDIGATETVTVGTGSAASGGGTSSAGGTSSFGSHCSATGGTGSTTSNCGDPGTGSSGDINLTGAGGYAGGHSGVAGGGDTAATGTPGGPGYVKCLETVEI